MSILAAHLEWQGLSLKSGLYTSQVGPGTQDPNPIGHPNQTLPKPPTSQSKDETAATVKPSLMLH